MFNSTLTMKNNSTQDSFPNSKKIFVKGKLHNIKVAMREIDLADTKDKQGNKLTGL